MAFNGEDIDLQTLLNEVIQFFKQPNVVSKNIVNQGYQAPIKGTWASSGGFDPVSIRPSGKKGHMGVDMRAPGGTPIYPLAPGIITNVGTDPLGGNVINIQHENGVRSYYAHLSTANVHKGDRVNYDTVIGAVGNTGNAKNTVPHLHFQVWKDNQIQNPNQYFTVPPYTQLSNVEKIRGPWLSEQAKQNAINFNMQQHNRRQRIALTQKADQLLKYTYQFNKLLSG